MKLVICGSMEFAEMAVAFYLRKPIYLLFPIPEIPYYKEEMFMMSPIILDGDLEKI